jgi:ribosomal protein S6
MTEDTNLTSSGPEAEASVSDERRVYELGYLMVSTLSESDREKVLAGLRADVESKGGTFISEGAPAELALAYTMFTRDREKNVPHEMAFFGWLKFEVAAKEAEAIASSARVNKNLIRSLFFETVKEDTRASILPTLKDVKRTGTIGTGPRTEDEKKEVSEAELDKTVDSIVADLV